MSDAAAQWDAYRAQHLQRLYGMLNAAGDSGVSDLHVIPDQAVYSLQQGELQRTATVVSQNDILEWLRKPGQQGTITDSRLGDSGHVSIAYDTGTYRARGAFRRATHGVSVTFRLIPTDVPTADSVGVPPQVQALMSKVAGLIILEGPTGSGKTTSIAGLINKVNMEMDKHIYLIEHPIEFVHTPHGNSVITQREVGEHVSTYTDAVESALRSTPNVILVGELLDPATTRAALHAATTGHLVITTAHAGSVTEAIDGFIGQFTADEQPQIRSRLAQTLLAVQVQKLVRGVDGRRHVAHEVLLHNRNFQELIMDDASSHVLHQQLSAGGKDGGSFTLESSLAKLAADGKISVEAALDQARDSDALRDDLRHLGVQA